MNKVILFLFIILFVSYGCEEQKEVVDAKDHVLLFVKEINPELHHTMFKMDQEIAIADNKIQLLYDLKDRFPNQREMIKKSLKQWQALHKDLNVTLNTIYEKVEVAYVTYKIDEIQGRQKFSKTSQALLIEAKAVLASAETTKSLIEEELNE
ncbi:MAG: hypothetical protein DRR16_17755 [Candidatus Parabeggiatoa sp. nov. 3]|jgi:hypothetical protein|nr:MAG: hypothetical protein DRR00_24740 [Gammaproteobacteria bacterium]RKZ67495.1 MAG: hypothetical protein DRQ99_06565 [Gammaproteobacteria bacterium]RKZ83253.1 MAG: hypothetical protein DRR16_17755 [Gammaproteobacteria bacterium]